jgi:hypothetical protein
MPINPISPSTPRPTAPVSTGTTARVDAPATAGAGGAADVRGPTASALASPLTPEQQAVKKMRDLVKTGQLSKLYADLNGSDPVKAKEALDFFASLPKISGDTPVDQLVKLGVITAAPAGLDAVQRSARYLPGRQVQIETTIDTERPKGWGSLDQTSFLKFKEGGQKGLTHRASIVGERGNDYLVKVDGRDEPLAISKREVHELNQPQLFKGDRYELNGVRVDYSTPYMKAKVHECFARMDEHLQKLDFNKALNPDAAPGGVAGFLLRNQSEPADLQKKCVRIVHDAIRMSYSHDMNAGDDAGKLAMGGAGQCYSQAAVMAGLLAPFTDLLAIDVRFINGKVYRNADANRPGYPYNGGNHGWLQVTLRPSMETAVVDRTWGQPWTSMDAAYSWTGDRVPRDRIQPSNRWGRDLAAATTTDADFSGRVRLEQGERKFGVKGVDDRDANHMSRRQ